MRAKKGPFVTASLLVCLGIFLGLNAFAQVRGVTKDTIQLGMILVKTGPVAALGLPEGWGIQDTFNHLNETGGINGRKINLIWEDDQFRLRWLFPLSTS